jgi:hypothetical protein
MKSYAFTGSISIWPWPRFCWPPVAPVIARRKDFAKKEQSTIRLYLEGNRADVAGTGTVLVTRHRFPYTIEREPFLTEDDLRKVVMVNDPGPNGGYSIELIFNEHGALMLDMLTTANKGRHIVVFSQFPHPGYKPPKEKKKPKKSDSDDMEHGRHIRPPSPRATGIGKARPARASGWLAAVLIRERNPSGIFRFSPDASREETARIVRGLKNVIAYEKSLGAIDEMAQSCLASCCSCPRAVSAQPFQLPTANKAIFESGGQERYFVPTTGKTWVSGTFGCVRSDGWQMHEGLDIKCLQRDRAANRRTRSWPPPTASSPTSTTNRRSPIMAATSCCCIASAGWRFTRSTRICRKSKAACKVGQPVRAGEQIAVMGRTSNTRERISKERAHVHFELNLFYSDHFNPGSNGIFPANATTTDCSTARTWWASMRA